MKDYTMQIHADLKAIEAEDRDMQKREDALIALLDSCDTLADAKQKLIDLNVPAEAIEKLSEVFPPSDTNSNDPEVVKVLRDIAQYLSYDESEQG